MINQVTEEGQATTKLQQTMVLPANIKKVTGFNASTLLTFKK